MVSAALQGLGDLFGNITQGGADFVSLALGNYLSGLWPCWLSYRRTAALGKPIGFTKPSRDRSPFARSSMAICPENQFPEPESSLATLAGNPGQSFDLARRPRGPKNWSLPFW